MLATSVSPDYIWWCIGIFTFLTILGNVTGAFKAIDEYRDRQREWLRQPEKRRNRNG